MEHRLQGVLERTKGCSSGGAALASGLHDDGRAFCLQLNAIGGDGHALQLMPERQGPERDTQNQALAEQEPGGLVAGRTCRC